MFLPTNYEPPSGNANYMKLQNGENKIRILSQPIIGWLDWVDGKPVRYKYDDKPLKPSDPAKSIKHFWSMIVWNYAEEKIQILEVTQATIQKSLKNLSVDQDWGAPYFYDIKISRTGEGMKTDYGTNPIAPKPVTESVIKAFIDKPCNLEALYRGEDPFVIHNNVYTKGIFTKDALSSTNVPRETLINEEQYKELRNILTEVSNGDKATIMEKLKKEGVDELINMPSKFYDSVKNAAIKFREEFRTKPEKFDLF